MTKAKFRGTEVPYWKHPMSVSSRRDSLLSTHDHDTAVELDTNWAAARPG